MSLTKSQLLTRQALETALLQLLEHESLAQISITKLTKHAGVPRNSFYRNYDNKTDILRGLLRTKLAKLAQTNVETYARNPAAGLLAIFAYFKADKDFYKLLIREGLLDVLEDELYMYQPNATKESTRISYYKNSLVAAAMSKLLIEWLKDDCQEPIADLVLQIS